MNAVHPGLPAPLINLMGASWAMGTPVAASAWFATGDAIAFALADGTLAIARAHWEGAASLRPRAGGGVELVPATAPPPPVMRVRCHEGPCLTVAGGAGDTVVSGGADGRFAQIDADGDVETLASVPGAPIAAVAAHHGLLACAAGSQVRLFGRTPACLELPGPVGALAFDPSGGQLAIGFPQGVRLSSPVTADRTLPCAGTPLDLAWSPDASVLVCGLAEQATHAWRLPDGAEIAMGDTAGLRPSLSFSNAGGFVATGGSTRLACWQFDGADGTTRRTECGPGGGVAITRVACHPARTLIAAGYGNGAVLLSQPETADILFVRAAGGGGVSALAWSADGAFLSIGTEAGEVGVIAFPERLFRPLPTSPTADTPERSAT